MNKSYLMTNSIRETRDSKSGRHRHSTGRKRRMFSERLEIRAMLNGDWHNPIEASDVDGDGYTSPLDALHVINELNFNGPRKLNSAKLAARNALLIDAFEDDHLSPLDAMTVLNAIGAEGEEHDIVQLRMETTDTDGNPITQIDVGQDFLLRAMVQDLTGRENGGVFAAYLDVTYESSIVSIAGEIEHGDDYGNAPAGDLSVAGVIDEAGSIDGLTELGPNELLLFTVPMRADADGSVTFLPDPADLSPAHDILVFGVTDEGFTNIPTDRVAYVPTTLQVGESEAIQAVDDDYELQGEMLVVGAGEGVLVNDVNPFGGDLAAALIEDVEHGELSLAIDGSFTYTPDAGQSEADSFTYQASVNGNTSNVATVSINVLADNSIPVATEDAYQVDEDQVLTTTTSVLANDTDADGDTLTATIVSGPSDGTLELASDGQFVYTPNQDFSGTDSFEYTANDESSSSAPATVTITVINSNDAPVAQDDAYIGSDGAITIDATGGVLANDTDADDDALTARVDTEPTNGTITLNDDGSFVYTPDEGFVGDDSFIYVANDGLLDSNVGTVTLTIESAAATQVRVRLSPTDLDGVPISVISPGGEFLLQVFVQDTGTPPRDGVFAAYVDVTYDSALVSLDGALDFSGEYVNLPSGDTSTDGLIDEVGAFASLSELGDGEFLLVSIPMVASGVGIVEFGSDPADDSPAHDILLFGENEPVAVEFVDYGSAQLEVVGGDAPVASDDAYTGSEDTEIVADAATGVLANDTDSDGNGLTAILESGPTNGQLILNADGSFSYTPDADFNGSDSFSYRANDGVLSSNIAMVSLAVEAVDDAPISLADAYTLDTVGDLVVSVENGVLANDVDVDGDTMTAVLVDGPSSGTVTLNEDGSFTYSPNEGFVGVDTFTYRAVANGVESASAEVTIEVGDTSPSSISGFVFSDTNNDGIMDAGEARYGGVRMRLQGMDLLGNMIFEEIRTSADGSYQFTDVLQGTYTVTEFQPLHLIDGKDRINGRELSLRNDRYEVEITAGMTLTNYNFGERGLAPQFITNPMFFASRTDHGLLIMANGAGELEWYCMDAGWVGITDVDVQLASNRGSATVTTTGTLGGVESSSIDLDVNRSARILTGSPSQGHLIRLVGDPESFGLAPNGGLEAEAVDEVFGN